MTAAVDMFPHILRKGYRKEIFIGIVCCSCFLVGLPMVMNVSITYGLFNFGQTVLIPSAFVEIRTA